MDWEILDSWRVKADSDVLTYKEASDNHSMILHLINFCGYHKLPSEFIRRLTEIDGALWRKMKRTPQEDKS